MFAYLIGELRLFRHILTLLIDVLLLCVGSQTIPCDVICKTTCLSVYRDISKTRMHAGCKSDLTKLD